MEKRIQTQNFEIEKMNFPLKAAFKTVAAEARSWKLEDRSQMKEVQSGSPKWRNLSVLAAG